MLTVCTFISGSLFEFRVLFAKGFAAQPAASWPDLSWGANSISVATKQISYVYIIYVYTHVIINDNNLFKITIAQLTIIIYFYTYWTYHICSSRYDDGDSCSSIKDDII